MRRILALMLTVVPLICMAQYDGNDVTLNLDSVWVDSIDGRRVHLQIMGGEDTCVYVKPRPLVALGKDLGINAAILAWDYYIQDRHYARISKNVLEDHFKRWPVWDGDSFSGNQFSHPYHGSLFYNSARNEGLSYGVSLLYPMIGSLTWEYFCETNPPSMNDLLSTGIGGAAVGEVTHRLSDIFFDDSKVGYNRVVREILGSALNPVRAVHRLLSGETWRISHTRGKRLQPQPYTFELGVGHRYMIESKGHKEKMGVPYIDFNFEYGKRFNGEGRSKAFDLFSVSLLANLEEGHPTIGNMEIMGRLADRQIEGKDDWNFDIGFYQHIKYVDHYSEKTQRANNFAIISEAVSFGGGFYAEKEKSHTRFSNDAILSAVPLGGTTADYYPFRRYDFGIGFSLRNNTIYAFNGKGMIGNQFYFSRLYTPQGYSPEEIQRRIEGHHGFSCWGDQGNHLILTNNLFAQYKLYHHLRLNVGHQCYFRHSDYKYYPSVKARSHEWKVGIIYSI